MQPIKNNIQEEHKNFIKEEPSLTLLVDGNSLLFNSFADPTANADGVLIGPIYQVLLQLRIQLTKRQFSRVFVSFDDEFSGALRYQIYNEYKRNRNKHYEDYGVSDYMRTYNERLRNVQQYIFNKGKDKDKEVVNDKEGEKCDWEKFVDENFDRCRSRLCLYFNEIGIRWYMDEVCEGDDLIAYYCKKKKKNEKILIISSDMDLCQLLGDDIIIYNQTKKIYISNKNFKQYFGYDHRNVLTRKILLGDTSDNIGNIKLLSEKKLYDFYPEIKEKAITISEVVDRAKEVIEERKKNKQRPLQVYYNIVNGVSNKVYNGDFYEINRKIIDLNNPIITDEMKSEMDDQIEAPLDMTERNFKNLVRLINEDKISELMTDTKFSSFFAPFKRIYESEKKYFLTNTKD